MLREPRNHADPAASAAAHPRAPAANSNTGSGANQSSGHHGVMPVPNQTSSAVSRTATQPNAARRGSRTKAIQISPERAPIKGAECSARKLDAAPEVERDEAVRERAHLECDFPCV